LRQISGWTPRIDIGAIVTWSATISSSIPPRRPT
jgi:hypothetical protein